MPSDTWDPRHGPYAVLATWNYEQAAPDDLLIVGGNWGFAQRNCQTLDRAFEQYDMYAEGEEWRGMWVAVYDYDRQAFIKAVRNGYPNTFRDFSAQFVSEDLNLPRKNMVNLKVKREGGKLYLYVNAQELHNTLDAVGATHTNGVYTDRPTTTVEVADPERHSISTNVLLRREYPYKADLSRVFNEPPSIQNIRRLCESAHEQTRKVLEHYQPIDISIEIHKKVLK